MGRITGNEHPAFLPLSGKCRLEGIDRLSFKTRCRRANPAGKKVPDSCLLEHGLWRLIRADGKFPPPPPPNIPAIGGWPVRVAILDRTIRQINGA